MCSLEQVKGIIPWNSTETVHEINTRWYFLQALWPIRVCILCSSFLLCIMHLHSFFLLLFIIYSLLLFLFIYLLLCVCVCITSMLKPAPSVSNLDLIYTGIYKQVNQSRVSDKLLNNVVGAFEQKCILCVCVPGIVFIYLGALACWQVNIVRPLL